MKYVNTYLKKGNFNVDTKEILIFSFKFKTNAVLFHFYICLKFGISEGGQKGGKKKGKGSAYQTISNTHKVNFVTKTHACICHHLVNIFLKFSQNWLIAKQNDQIQKRDLPKLFLRGTLQFLLQLLNLLCFAMAGISTQTDAQFVHDSTSLCALHHSQRDQNRM